MNLRRHTSADLQSAAFDRSAIPPDEDESIITYMAIYKDFYEDVNLNISPFIYIFLLCRL